MMLYVATVFWILVIVLTAGGVHQLWSAMVKPRVINVILLPGTLVAQMGHVLGLLITGATVTNTTLIKDDETAEPQHTSDPKPRIPFVGPVVIGMLPIVTCATAIFAAARWLGGGMIADMAANPVPRALPLSLVAFWQGLRDLISLMEDALTAVLSNSPSDWRAWTFVYLLVCLTVRMAPFPGNLRGSLGAIVLLGVMVAVLGRFFDQAGEFIESGWQMLSLCVATLLVLLLLTAVVRGGVALVRAVRNG